MAVDAVLPGPGHFQIEVVGESRYQDVLETLTGGRTFDGVEQVFDAALVLEDTNPHDNKAVQVFINGYLCGYLSRDDARAYRNQLKKAGQPRITASCKAMVVGGWDRGRADRGHFGVKLDLPYHG